MLKTIVNSFSFIHLGNDNDLLILVDEEKNSILSNSQTKSVLFTFNFNRLAGERIFETQDHLTDSLRIVLGNFTKEFLYISVNLYSIHRSSASMNSEKSPFLTISLCFLISSSSSGVRVESISSSMDSSIRSILFLISLNSFKISARETVSCIVDNLVKEIDKCYFSKRSKYLSISSSFFNINMPNSVKTYALDPFGESSRRIGLIKPVSISSLIPYDNVFLSTTFSRSLHLLGPSRSARSILKLPVFDTFLSKLSVFSFIQLLLVFLQFITWFNNSPTIVGKSQTINMVGNLPTIVGRLAT